MPRVRCRSNLFHGRDGAAGSGATRRSALPEEPVAAGPMHVNRKRPDEMARLIAAPEPDVCALQEVPTAAIADDRAERRACGRSGPRPGR